MSFTATVGGADRAFELVRQSLLQGESLAFADVLTAEQMQQAFDAEGVSFGEADATARPMAMRMRSRMMRGSSIRRRSHCGRCSRKQY